MDCFEESLGEQNQVALLIGCCRTRPPEGFRICVRSKRKPQISPLRYPDFLLKLLALANIMRLSKEKGALAALSSAAWQEIRVRS
jgi:hypothetical protein